MNLDESMKEMVNILKEENMIARHMCLKEILGFTGTVDSCNVLLNNKNLIETLISFMVNNNDLSKLSCLTLINISAYENLAKILFDYNSANSSQEDCIVTEILNACFANILNQDNKDADSCCMLLCNLSRTFLHANYIVNHFTYFDDDIVGKLVDAFCNLKYNNKGGTLDYLAPFFSNVSQSSSGAEFLYPHAQRLITFTQYNDSTIRRGGIVGMLRNFSFRTEKHMWLLDEEGINILPALLLPLAGPEEFAEDDIDKLPIELQYLPETKERDPDPDIRRMLLETLLQFCSNKEERTILRNRNVYVILRELHKYEKDRQVLLACENVVDILIRTEDEIGVDEINSLQVPEDLQEKFQKMDNDFLNDD